MRRLLLLTLLAGCQSWPPPPCPPYCAQTPMATRTPTSPAPKPTTGPTSVATRTVVPSPQSLPPGPLAPLTEGRAVIELDLRAFVLDPGLDSYAFGTWCWTDPKAPVQKKDRPRTPCIQLGIRGTNPADMRIEARYSGNPWYDGTIHDEARMCGEGTRPPRWVKLIPGIQTHTVALEWGPGYVRVSTAAGSATLTQGAAPGDPVGSTAVPGFGWWDEGIPPGGIAWSYREDWTLQQHGGVARLLRWEAVGVQGVLGACP